MTTKNVECALCHAVHTDSSAANASDPWRCHRCGQRWDATRLATVADYQRWAKGEAATFGYGAPA